MRAARHGSPWSCRHSIHQMPCSNCLERALTNAASVAVRPRQGTSVISPDIARLKRSRSFGSGITANAAQSPGTLKVLLAAKSVTVRAASRSETAAGTHSAVVVSDAAQRETPSAGGRAYRRGCARPPARAAGRHGSRPSKAGARAPRRNRRASAVRRRRRRGRLGCAASRAAPPAHGRRRGSEPSRPRASLPSPAASRSPSRYCRQGLRWGAAAGRSPAYGLCSPARRGRAGRRG